MTKERIEVMREAVLPFCKEKLVEINYEGLGKSDAEEFEKDFNELLNLASQALEQKSSWIPVSERLPENEQKVLVLALYRNNIHTITTGMHEDGSMPECDSIWNWEDVEYEKWDDENDCGIIPEGWYEYHEFNPDGLLNYSIPDKVVAWMPLPEPAEVEVKE